MLSRLNKLILASRGFSFDNTKTTATVRLEATSLLQLRSPYLSIYMAEIFYSPKVPYAALR